MLLKGSPTQILLQIELFIMNVAQIDWKIKFHEKNIEFWDFKKNPISLETHKRSL